MTGRSGYASNRGARLEWADQARGIGILLILLAHTQFASSLLGDYVDTFRTTLFFFVAGCLFSWRGYDSFGAFVKRKAVTTLVPYAVFALVSYVYGIVRFQISDSEYHQNLSLARQFFGIFYSAGTTEWMDFNLPLWYFTCLFVVQILFYALRKTVKSDMLLVLILILLSLAGYAEGLWNPYRLPWGMDVAVTAAVFFGFGHLLFPEIRAMLKWPLWLKAALAGLLFLPNFAFDDPLMNLNMKLHGHYYDFYWQAFSGILLCVLVSGIIRSRVLLYLGRNSIILTASHMPLLGISTKIMDQAGFISHSYAVEMIRALLTVLMTIPLILWANRYPALLGRGLKRSGNKKRAYPAAGWTISGMEQDRKGSLL